MKRLLSFALALFLLIPFPVLALGTEYEGDGFSLSFPENYYVLDQNNLKDYEEFIYSIDENSVSSFKRNMQNANMLIYAAPADNSEQMQFLSWSDSISETIHSLSSLDDQLFKTAVDSIGDLVESDGLSKITLSEKVTVGDVVYIKFIVDVTQAKQRYGSVQYLTVADDRFYALVYYNQSGPVTDAQNKRAENVFVTLNIEVDHPVNLTYYFLRISGILIIIAAVIAAVFIVRSISRDLKESKHNEEKIPNKIKMDRRRRK